MENKKETWKLRQIVAKKLRLPQRGQRCGGREELPCELLQPVDSKLFSFFQSLEQKNFAFGFNVQGWECSPCTQPCWHRGWRWLPTCSCCRCRPSPTERNQVSFTHIFTFEAKSTMSWSIFSCSTGSMHLATISGAIMLLMLCTAWDMIKNVMGLRWENCCKNLLDSLAMPSVGLVPQLKSLVNAGRGSRWNCSPRKINLGKQIPSWWVC